MRLMPFSQAWGDARSHAMVVNDDTAHLTPLSALGLIASRLAMTLEEDLFEFFPDATTPLSMSKWRGSHE